MGPRKQRVRIDGHWSLGMCRFLTAKKDSLMCHSPVLHERVMRFFKQLPVLNGLRILPIKKK